MFVLSRTEMLTFQSVGIHVVDTKRSLRMSCDLYSNLSSFYRWEYIELEWRGRRLMDFWDDNFYKFIIRCNQQAYA
jgi:hypothetical protein